MGYRVVCVVLVGCGSSHVAPDAALHDAPPADAAPDAAPCNALSTEATAMVTEQFVQTAAPTPAGGPLTDGAYVLTDSKVYVGPTGPTGATGQTFLATSYNHNGSYDYVDPNAGVHNHGTYATANVADIAIVQTCPTMVTSGFAKYDATTTTFSIYDMTLPFGGVRVQSFTRVGP